MLDHTATQGLVIRNPNKPQLPSIEGLVSDDELSAEVEALIANEVNPALAAHGGFVTYVGHDGEGSAVPHHGRRLPRLLDESHDHARRRADDAGRAGARASSASRT